MDAKEYLERKGLCDHDYSDSGMIKHISEMMEEYHQAKSKEEAEEKYEMAGKFIKKNITWYNFYDRRTELGKIWDKAFRIASGKE
ncbi:hypothetical protein LCGC14_2885480 [marine sediment metagenome]|uniref:Uncharacterized protein n=1 Tax=marine sediment metagenome TaxID=412755 RepID=A0A0F8YKK6_9ZZZZ